MRVCDEFFWIDFVCGRIGGGSFVDLWVDDVRESGLEVLFGSEGGCWGVVWWSWLCLGEVFNNFS